MIRENQFKGEGVKLFVILGGLHYVAMKNIIEHDASSTKYVCMNFTRFSIDVDHKKVVVINYFQERKIKFVLSYIRFFRDVKLLGETSSFVDLFIPHIYHSSTNYLAYNLPYRGLYLLPDGLLNYYDSPVGRGIYDGMFKKRVLSRMLGGNYRAYSGHLTGYDILPFDSCYVFDKTSLFTKVGAVRELGSISNNYVGNPGSVLFLDQPLEYIPESHHAAIRSALNSYLVGAGKLYYKAHTLQQTPSLTRGDFPDMIDIDSFLPAEMIVEKYQISKVVSLMGTVLITISKLYPRIKCVSIGMNRFVADDSNLLTAANVISRLGVEIIDA